MTVRIHVLTTVPEGPLGYYRRDAERLVTLLSACGRPEVHIEPDARRAQTVIFVGSSHRSLLDVRASPVFRSDPHKCLVVHSGDEPLPTVPGIYASVPRRWYDRSQHRAGFYLRTAVDASIPCLANEMPRYLFSFVGSAANHPVRDAVMRLRSADALLIDSARHPVSQSAARDRFVHSLRASLFVLCPRGGGTSSLRIFETMMAGRVPVIVSDDWVEPEGPQWSSFSVRVAQRDVHSLPRRLAEIESQAIDMGRRARDAWQTWFSPETAGATLLAWIGELQRQADPGASRRLPRELVWRVAADEWRARAGRAMGMAAVWGAARS